MEINSEILPHNSHRRVVSDSSRHSIAKINDSDRAHLSAFAAQRKAQIMKKIMSVAPSQNMVYQGDNRFEKAMISLHREGFGLIDLQQQDTSFTSVWYRKTAAFLGRGGEVAMLVWEADENGDSTTLLGWKI